MKIFLTNGFSEKMGEQPKDELLQFIEYVDKLTQLNKKQILALDSVFLLSSPEDKEKVYAYSIPNDFFVVFSFTSKNQLLLLDRVQYVKGTVLSTTFSDSK